MGNDEELTGKYGGRIGKSVSFAEKTQQQAAQDYVPFGSMVRVIVDGDRMQRQISHDSGKTWLPVQNVGFSQPQIDPTTALHEENDKLRQRVRDYCSNWQEAKLELRRANDTTLQAIAAREQHHDRTKALEDVYLAACRYHKAQSARYQRELGAAIDEVEKYPK